VRFVSEERVVYGVNTSMGGFVDWLVPTTMATALQENLINAVATNVGSYVDDRTARSIMLSRIPFFQVALQVTSRAKESLDLTVRA
jgi:histidine ammonia-lyase